MKSPLFHDVRGASPPGLVGVKKSPGPEGNVVVKRRQMNLSNDQLVFDLWGEGEEAQDEQVRSAREGALGEVPAGPDGRAGGSARAIAGAAQIVHHDLGPSRRQRQSMLPAQAAARAGMADVAERVQGGAGKVPTGFQQAFLFTSVAAAVAAAISAFAIPPRPAPTKMNGHPR